jgi:hypothetical protein
MATTAASFNFYTNFKKNIGNGVIDLDTHTFKLALCTSSYTPNASTHEFYDVSITNELTTANGYTVGGVALGSVTWTLSGGNFVFDSDDPTWTASGTGITARYWILYDDTPVSSKPLVAYGYLDNTPADVTASAGNTLEYIVPATGWFTL